MLLALLLLAGCRYRLSYAGADTPEEPDYTFGMASGAVTNETPPPNEAPQDEDEALPDDEESEAEPDDEPEPEPPLDEHEPLSSQEPQDETEPPLNAATTHTEATTDDLSPITMEMLASDARQYAIAEGDYYTTVGTQAGVDANNVVTIEEPATDGDGATIEDSGDGGVVGVIAIYSTLLRQGVNTLFPCQLFYIYVETPADFVTVPRGSNMYQLMVDAGGINVSSRLSGDMLTVTADWVVRRNPDIIVKFVDDTVLGSEVTSTQQAAQVRAAIMQREGWGAIEAVSNGHVVLLSMAVLETEEARLAAMLAVARLMYPTLFEGIDADGVIAGLIGGMSGIHIFS